MRRLAGAILAGGFPLAGSPPPDAVSLSAMRIFVPTRRAAKNLQAAFLEIAGGATLLPLIMPLGDMDEDELLLAPQDLAAEAGLTVNLPPVIPPLTRRLVLARLVRAWTGRVSLESGTEGGMPATPAQMVQLAAELARLMDAVDIGETGWEGLERLVPEDLALNWQLTVAFLKIVTDQWPAFLNERGFMAPMAHRNALIEAQVRLLQQAPPDVPVIAAGSTGSTPATAKLLAAIARLPSGAVVLPGLDPYLDEESWEQLTADHPQFGMRQLLERMEAVRADVALLPGADIPAPLQTRNRLVSELMRPAATTGKWHGAIEQMERQGLEAALAQLSLIEAPSPQEEARCIALIMRETLEHKDRTAALVTADRHLARRVAAELRRWDIGIEDSAGRPLHRTGTGIFLLLAAKAVASGFAPVDLLALLHHPLCRVAPPRALCCLDLALRGPRPAAGLAALRRLLTEARDSEGYVHPANKRQSAAGWQAALAVLEALETAGRELLGLHAAGQAAELPRILAAHLDFTEALNRDGDGVISLWSGEAGEAAMTLAAAIEVAAVDYEPLTPADYAPLLETLMADVPVRPRRRQHRRLAILGVLEARLLQPDVLILGGLNEGTWPGEARPDPWLSRPMRAQMGLEPPERRIGLSAHDFAMGLGAPQVILSRARKVNGTPAVPSRWLLRLRTLLEGAGLGTALSPDRARPWLGWALGLDDTREHQPVRRPSPRPPVAARPRTLSVTRIERWIRDPYEIYARHILGLEPLDKLHEAPGAADRGLIIHDILHGYVSGLPEGGGLEALLRIGAEKFAALDAHPDLQAFWQWRFERIAAWFVEHERHHTPPGTRHLTETRGRLEIDAGAGFTLTARADRIDIAADGRAAIIDYKTGLPPSAKQVKAGLSPQLPLEAAILLAGGFEGSGRHAVDRLVYIRLSGGQPPGEVKLVSKDVPAAELAESALTGLTGLVTAYADAAQGYLPRTTPQYERDFTPYDQLSRAREWVFQLRGGTGGNHG